MHLLRESFDHLLYYRHHEKLFDHYQANRA